MMATPVSAFRASRFGDVVTVEGAKLERLHGYPIARLAVLTCRPAACAPIAFQIDERDPNGRWVLDQGPQPNHDEPAGEFDASDLLLFMASDTGHQANARQMPRDMLVVEEIAVTDPSDGSTQWAYVAAFAHAAPRSTRTYVAYDPSADRIRGARVALGFNGGIPDYLAVANQNGADAANLLDRFKVRAGATFLFGLVRFSRDESDLTTEFVAWRAGPIRVIRSQRQWVRLGWGIRSPTFGSYTYFYRDFAELPVGLRLNFPPTYFFGDIIIRVVVDFRDLTGWRLVVPSRAEPIPIDGTMTPEKALLNDLSDTWFALIGPEIALVQSMDLGPTLSSVRHRLLFEEDRSRSDPPEAVPGTQPGIGYRLDRWEAVGAGAHVLAAASYALPQALDARVFMESRSRSLVTAVTRQDLRQPAR